MATYRVRLLSGSEVVWAAEIEAADRDAAFEAVKEEAHRRRDQYPLRGESVLAVQTPGAWVSDSAYFHNGPADFGLTPNPYAGGACEVPPEVFHAMRSAGIEDKPEDAPMPRPRDTRQETAMSETMRAAGHSGSYVADGEVVRFTAAAEFGPWVWGGYSDPAYQDKSALIYTTDGEWVVATYPIAALWQGGPHSYDRVSEAVALSDWLGDAARKGVTLPVRGQLPPDVAARVREVYPVA